MSEVRYGLVCVIHGEGHPARTLEVEHVEQHRLTAICRRELDFQLAVAGDNEVGRFVLNGKVDKLTDNTKGFQRNMIMSFHLVNASLPCFVQVKRLMAILQTYHIIIERYIITALL